MKNLEREIVADILKLEDKRRAKELQKFFQTGPGQYGEGDVFLGLRVPVLRKIVKKYQREFLHLEVKEILGILQNLLDSKYHELRMSALYLLLFINENEYRKLNKNTKTLTPQSCISGIAIFYKDNIAQNINSWDLVDSSAYQIIGRYCYEFKKDNLILNFVQSRNVWEKRVAIVSNFYYLKKGQDSLLYDLYKYKNNMNHDLLHKAYGWMLREAGKKVSRGRLIDFLKENYHTMPSVMRSYACEHLNAVEKVRIRSLFPAAK